ncbi:hypothetical protein GDO81_019987 [Engystomops pustulosus]|uniref:Uncharacterized protein n=1 Tax=Engystomops pustulosus TaxID=76066 RepID=A0AAV6YTJ7_ENGPU|nr:hypothetical protein GDO81_019987 [Engystomops pustulosus]
MYIHMKTRTCSNILLALLGILGDHGYCVHSIYMDSGHSLIQTEDNRSDAWSCLSLVSALLALFTQLCAPKGWDLGVAHNRKEE